MKKTTPNQQTKKPQTKKNPNQQTKKHNTKTLL